MTLKQEFSLSLTKESMRARGLSSPDRADAVIGAPLCLCLASPGAPPWIPSPTWTSGESGSRPARSNSAGSPDYSGPIAPPDGVRQPACPGSGRRIALVDSKGSVANAAARSPAIRNNFFGNILREPSSRGCSRQALRDATLSSDFLNGKRFSMPWLSVPFQSAWSNGARKGYGGYEWI